MTLATTTAPHRTSGPIGQINTEWAQISQHPTPAAWAAAHLTPATLGELLDELRSASRATVDATFHALLVLTRNGDEFAGRVLFQAMLPKVVRHERTALGRNLPDPMSVAITAMWTSIATYPLHRTTSVAANLAMDALRHIPPAHDTHESPLPLSNEDEFLGVDDALHHNDELAALRALTGDDDPTIGRGLIVEVLQWALDHETLSRDDVALLALIHLRDDDKPLTLKVAGAQLGLSHSAARQRHARAVRALSTAVAASLKMPAAA